MLRLGACLLVSNLVGCGSHQMPEDLPPIQEDKTNFSAIPDTLDIGAWNDSKNLDSFADEWSFETSLLGKTLSQNLNPVYRALGERALQKKGSAADVLELLGAEESKEARRIGSRITALRVLEHGKITIGEDEFRALWTLFLRARLGILQEDPDLFERAARLLTEGANSNPAAFNSFIQKGMAEKTIHVLIELNTTKHPDLVGKTEISLMNDWRISKDLDAGSFLETVKKLAAPINRGWQEQGLNWIKGFQSEQGDMTRVFIESSWSILLNSWKKTRGLKELAAEIQTREQMVRFSGNPFRPPAKIPGQYQDLAPPKPNSVQAQNLEKEFSVPGNIKLGMFGSLLTLLSGWIAFRTRKKSALILIGVGLLILLESLLSLFDRQQHGMVNLYGLNESSSSIIGRNFQPLFRFSSRSGSWYSTNGGPSRFIEFKQEKEENELRVLIFGASSAHASNHLKEESFSHLVEQKLRQNDPDRPINFINLSVGGTNSGGILSLAAKSMQLEADGLILFYGHNEAAHFNQLTDAENLDPVQLKWRIWLNDIQLFRLMEGLFKSTPKIRELKNKNINRRDRSVKFKELATKNYRQNIDKTLELAHKNGLHVLMMNVVSNYRFAPMEPFAIESSKEAISMLEDAKSMRPKDKDKALEFALNSTDMAESGSQTHLTSLKLSAELMAELQQHNAAREKYEEALDNADEISTVISPIRKATLQLSQKYGTAYIDLKELFYKNSPDGLSANGLFWDELHPSREGHRRIADSISPWAINLAEKTRIK